MRGRTTSPDPKVDEFWSDLITIWEQNKGDLSNGPRN